MIVGNTYKFLKKNPNNKNNSNPNNNSNNKQRLII